MIDVGQDSLHDLPIVWDCVCKMRQSSTSHIWPMKNSVILHSAFTIWIVCEQDRRAEMSHTHILRSTKSNYELIQLRDGLLGCQSFE